jgi:hypothetical protein
VSEHLLSEHLLPKIYLIGAKKKSIVDIGFIDGSDWVFVFVFLFLLLSSSFT